jgi:ribosomal-protein-alanine N-acetyltransferase
MNIHDIYKDLPPLKTDRLLLRKVALEDLDDMYVWASDPDVTPYVTWDAHKSVDETRVFINDILNRYKHAKLAPWAIVHREDRRMIGLDGFCTWEIKDRSAVFAYVLSKSYWRQGYTSEATRAIVDFGFQRMGLNRISARCRVENIGSARVMEKCGLCYEGTQREVAFVKNEFVDLKGYAITKKDWLQ